MTEQMTEQKYKTGHHYSQSFYTKAAYSNTVLQTGFAVVLSPRSQSNDPPALVEAHAHDRCSRSRAFVDCLVEDSIRVPETFLGILLGILLRCDPPDTPRLSPTCPRAQVVLHQICFARAGFPGTIRTRCPRQLINPM